MRIWSTSIIADFVRFRNVWNAEKSARGFKQEEKYRNKLSKSMTRWRLKYTVWFQLIGSLNGRTLSIKRTVRAICVRDGLFLAELTIDQSYKAKSASLIWFIIRTLRLSISMFGGFWRHSMEEERRLDTSGRKTELSIWMRFFLRK